MSEAETFPPPVVSGSTGFEEDMGGLELGEEAVELGAGEAMGAGDASRMVGDGDLEDGLGRSTATVVCFTADSSFRVVYGTERDSGTMMPQRVTRRSPFRHCSRRPRVGVE